MSKSIPDASSEIKDLTAEFFEKLRSALERGAAEYGDASFTKPNTADEILEEVVDIAGWAFVFYVQLKRRLLACEEALQSLEAGAKTHE